MENTFKQGSKAFIVENNWRTCEVRIISIAGGFATISFVDSRGITRLRLSRLFATKEEADATIKRRNRS